jgi:hypothetical protein
MMPNATRLAVLRDLRNAAEPKITQKDMAAFFNIKDQRTVGDWERGLATPPPKHRTRFILYLWSKLGLRNDPQGFEELWVILSEEWGWAELTKADRAPLEPTTTALPAKLAITVMEPPKLPSLPEIPNFVGRSTELKRYRDLLNRDGFVVIAGSPGVGKSALATRLCQQVAAAEQTFALQCTALDGVDDVIKKLAGWLYWQKNNRTIWQLLHTTTQRPYELLDNLFEQLYGAGILLYFDDFYLLNEPKPLLKKLLDAARKKALQVIFATRELSALAWMMEIQPLEGLQREDYQKLVERHGFTFTPTTVDQLHQRMAGNPQLLLLALDTLQSRGTVDQLLKRLLNAERVEQYLLEEVYHNLSAEERQTMHGVALFDGDPATTEAIEAVLNNPDTLRPTLAKLRRRYLLQLIDGEDTHAYGQHSLIRQFYYDLLGTQQRNDMHRRAAAYYEKRQQDFQAGLHYVYAGEDRRAAVYVTKAVRQRLSQGHSVRLQVILERIDTTRLPLQEQAQVILAKGQLYLYTQRTQLARQHLETAYQRFLTVDNLAETRSWQIQNCRDLGFLLKDSLPAEAVAWLQKGLALIVDDPEREADLSIQLADAYGRLGDRVAGREHLEKARALLPPDAGWLQLLVLIGLGKHYYLQNDLMTSALYMREALRTAEEQKDPFNMIAMRNNLAALSQITGAWAEAIEYYRQARSLVFHYGYLREGARIDLNSGVLYAQMGDQKAALLHLSRALGFAKSAELYDDQITSLSYLADLAIDEGNAATAASRLTEAEALLAQSQQNYLRPFVTYLHAKLHLLQKEYEQARAIADEAITIAQQLGMGQEEGLALRIRGEVVAALGDADSGTADFAASLSRLSGNPYEAARTKMAWGAQLLTRQQQQQTAQSLLQEANATFLALDARACIERIKKMVTSQ